MSLALPAFGQKAAMDSKLAGFGRSFRADIDAMIGKKLTCEGGRPIRRFNYRWFLTYPVSDRPTQINPHAARCKSDARQRRLARPPTPIGDVLC